MLVVLSADMEGISQLRDPWSILAFERAYWGRGRAQMTADVVAAAEGLLRGGADEVVVLDNHGSGHSENVIGSALPDGARLETWNVFDLPECGVDAMFQVGYHARGGLEAYISHTYVPGLRLRVGDELISESHGRIWAARVPLLGIVGNDVHQRTLGSLADVPYLAVQRTDSMAAMQPIFEDQASADEAISAFAAEVLIGGGITITPPDRPRLQAALDQGDDDAMRAGGWQPGGDAQYAIELDDWAQAREPIATAMGVAFGPWAPYFGRHELSSLEALDRVHDDPVLVEGRARFAAWLDGHHAQWPDR